MGSQDLAVEPAKEPKVYSNELAYINSVLSWRGAKKCLANYMGVSCSQITSYLNGDVIPSAEKYIQMKNFIRLSRAVQLTYLHDTVDDTN